MAIFNAKREALIHADVPWKADGGCVMELFTIACAKADLVILASSANSTHCFA